MNSTGSNILGGNIKFFSDGGFTTGMASGADERLAEQMKAVCDNP